MSFVVSGMAEVWHVGPSLEVAGYIGLAMTFSLRQLSSSFALARDPIMRTPLDRLLLGLMTAAYEVSKLQ
jgi:hypothetical protein